jgi:hypothetical protein
MSEPAKKSILDLYHYANEKQIVNNDMRRQQMIYNLYLVKNQASIPLILFGNGYLANYRELVLEMEGLSFLLNFGLIGFCLYFVPFIVIFIYGTYQGLRNIKKIDTEYVMYLAGLFCSFALSFLSGYTFFNSSSMMIIIVICVLLISKIHGLKNVKENHQESN